MLLGFCVFKFNKGIKILFKAKQQQKLWMPLRLCFIGHIDFNLRLKIPCVLDVCLCMCMFSLHSIEYCQIQKGLWYSLLVHCLNWLSLFLSCFLYWYVLFISLHCMCTYVCRSIALERSIWWGESFNQFSLFNFTLLPPRGRYDRPSVRPTDSFMGGSSS